MIPKLEHIVQTFKLTHLDKLEGLASKNIAFNKYKNNLQNGTAYFKMS